MGYGKLSFPAKSTSNRQKFAELHDGAKPAEAGTTPGSADTESHLSVEAAIQHIAELKM